MEAKPDDIPEELFKVSEEVRLQILKACLSEDGTMDMDLLIAHLTAHTAILIVKSRHHDMQLKSMESLLEKIAGITGAMQKDTAAMTKKLTDHDIPRPREPQNAT